MREGVDKNGWDHQIARGWGGGGGGGGGINNESQFTIVRAFMAPVFHVHRRHGRVVV